jgi:Ion channel
MFKTFPQGLSATDIQKAKFGVPFSQTSKTIYKNQKIYKKTVDIFSKALKVKRMDSSLENIKTSKKWYIIYHKGPYKLIFDFGMRLALLESNILSLYWLAFGEPTNTSIIYDTLMQSFFLIDFVLNFFTTYNSKKDGVITEQARIIKKYMKGWLIFDLLALIPLRVISWPSIEFTLRLSRIGKFDRILFMADSLETVIVKIIAMFYANKHVVKVVSNCFFSMAKLLGTMCYVVYLIACCFLRYCRLEQPNFEEYYFGGLPGTPGSMDNSPRLLRTAYFVLTTISSVGYGDFLPQNWSEYIAIIIIILAGAGYYGVLTAGFNRVIYNIHELWPSDDKLISLNMWMMKLEKRYKILNLELKNEILNHFKYYWSRDKLNNIAKEYWKAKTYDQLKEHNHPYFSQLTPELKEMMLDYLFKDTFSQHRNFFGDSKLKYELCYHFQPRIYHPGDVIIKKGDKVHELFLLKKGRIEIESEYDLNVYSFALNIPKCTIGDYEILSKEVSKVVYKAAISENSSVEGLAIPKKPFISILVNEFHEEEHRLRVLAQGKYNKIIKSVEDNHNKMSTDRFNATLETKENPKWYKNNITKPENLQVKYRTLDSNLEHLENHYNSISKKIDAIEDFINRSGTQINYSKKNSS